MLLDDFSQMGLFFLIPTPSQEKELKGGSVIDHLKTSLSRTLDIFYPLVGVDAMVFSLGKGEYASAEWTGLRKDRVVT